MRLTLVLLAVLALGHPRFATNAAAQAPDIEPDTVHLGDWAFTMVATLSASQAAYHNWREGGENTLTFTSSLEGRAIHENALWKQTHDLRLGFGQVRQDTLGFRKATDRILYALELQYQQDGPVDPAIAFELRTQFAPGFDYDRDPLDNGRQPPVKISDFFAPARMIQSFGFAYEYTDWIQVRLGVGAKQRIVTIPRLRPLYGMRENQDVRFEVGIESRTEFDREIFTNVRLRSRLSLFAAFNEPDLPDALLENLLRMRVNSWLNVDLEFVAYYDADISDDLQLKQLLSLGISFSVL